MARDLERFAGGSTPRRWAFAAGAAAAALLVAGVVWFALPAKKNVAHDPPRANALQPDQPPGLHLPPPSAPPAGTAEETKGLLEISVWKDNQRYDLDSALPLQSGDDVQIAWRLSKGLFGTLFWFDTDGALHELHRIEPDQTDAGTTLVWPEPGKSSVLVGPSGTEVIFLCASSLRCPTEEDIRPIVDEGGPWPELSGESLIEFDGAGVKVRGPTLRGPSDEFRARSEGRVRQRAETLLRELPEGFQVVRGVAFPHAEP